MALPEFNQENIDEKISEIKNMEAQDKEVELQAIRNNLRQYLQDNFDLNSDQEENLADMSDAFLEELGTGIAIAIDNNWDVAITPGSKDVPEGEVTQTVTGTWQQGQSPTYKKEVKISFKLKLPC